MVVSRGIVADEGRGCLAQIVFTHQLLAFVFAVVHNKIAEGRYIAQGAEHRAVTPGFAIWRFQHFCRFKPSSVGEKFFFEIAEQGHSRELFHKGGKHLRACAIVTPDGAGRACAIKSVQVKMNAVGVS